MTFTKEVLPAFCSPINESSISFLKKRLGVGSGCVELRQRVGSGDECAGTGETRGLAGEEERSSTSELKTRPEEEGFCPAPETRARGGGRWAREGRSGAVGTHLLSQSRKAVKRPMVSQFVSLGHYPTSALVFILDSTPPAPPLFSMSCI